MVRLPWPPIPARCCWKRCKVGIPSGWWFRNQTNLCSSETRRIFGNWATRTETWQKSCIGLDWHVVCKKWVSSFKVTCIFRNSINFMVHRYLNLRYCKIRNLTWPFGDFIKPDFYASKSLQCTLGSCYEAFRATISQVNFVGGFYWPLRSDYRVQLNNEFYIWVCMSVPRVIWKKNWKVHTKYTAKI